MGPVGSEMALVGSVMALVGLVGALVARLGLWCQCRRPSSSRKNTMNLDVHS